MSKKKPPKRVYVVVADNGSTSAVYRKRVAAESFIDWYQERATIHAYQLVEPKPRRAKS